MVKLHRADKNKINEFKRKTSFNMIILLQSQIHIVLLLQLKIRNQINEMNEQKSEQTANSLMGHNV